MLPEENHAHADEHPLLTSVPGRGLCRVVCFSPRHVLTLPEPDHSAIGTIISIWMEQTVELGAKDFVQYVQIFENKGAVMGCSNPHPHSQIWGTAYIINEPAKEFECQKIYFSEHGQPLLLDYVAEEHRRKERVLISNDHFTALIPYRAAWPFEFLVTAHRNIGWLSELRSAEISALAEVLQWAPRVTITCFQPRFPMQWDFTKLCSTVNIIQSGSYTRIFIRPYCVVPLFASSWQDMKCWSCRSAISRLNLPQKDCAIFQMCITNLWTSQNLSRHSRVNQKVVSQICDRLYIHILSGFPIAGKQIISE